MFICSLAYLLSLSTDTEVGSPLYLASPQGRPASRLCLSPALRSQGPTTGEPLVGIQRAPQGGKFEVRC